MNQAKRVDGRQFARPPFSAQSRHLTAYHKHVTRMTSMKIAFATALLFGMTAAASAQSAWTTGTASDRERAGYGSPYVNQSASGYYGYASRSGRFSFPFVPPSRWMEQSKRRTAPRND